MNEEMKEMAQFVQSLGLAEEFAAAFEESAYRAVPDNWMVATTDVVRSRDAIADGRYKAVNMAGVAVISALMNALSTLDIPYVFGGDGAAVVFASAQRQTVADTLAKVATFVSEELGLELRAAIVPVADLRAAGSDVRIEAVRLSDAVKNFAFTGGGISQAEQWMKEGKYLVSKAPPGSRPDLTGLSCRWTPIEMPGAKIISLIVEAGEHADTRQFAETARAIVERFGMGNPMPPEGPGVSWPVDGIELEARAARGNGWLWSMRLRLFIGTFLAYAVLRFGIPINGFDPIRYRRYTGLNTDFRKVQDGLRMTLALKPDEQARLEVYLEKLRRQGKIRFGLCMQDKAIITCFVPSVTEDNHLHFLDGAGGGYAGAASAIRD